MHKVQPADCLCKFTHLGELDVAVMEEPSCVSGMERLAALFGQLVQPH